MIGVICCQQALYIQNRERYYSPKSFLSQETERIQEHKDRAISDWLNLFGHYLHRKKNFLENLKISLKTCGLLLRNCSLPTVL